MRNNFNMGGNRPHMGMQQPKPQVAGAPAATTTPAAISPPARPQGQGLGNQFKTQFGSPPGHMRDQWRQFRGGGGMGSGAGGNPGGQSPEVFQQWRQAISQWRSQRPQPPGGFGQQPQRPQWAQQPQRPARPDWRSMMADQLAGSGG